MTHAAQEVCLSLVGAVRFRRGLLEIFLVFELFRLLLVDVAGGDEKMRYISLNTLRIAVNSLSPRVLSTPSLTAMK